MMTGWTLTHIYQELTLPRYNALQRFWARWPPPTVSLAHLAGLAPKPATDEATAQAPQAGEMSEGDFMELCAMFGVDPAKLPKAKKATS